MAFNKTVTNAIESLELSGILKQKIAKGEAEIEICNLAAPDY